MAAISALIDFTADCGLDDILNSIFNIEDKLHNSHVKIKSAGQQYAINLFFKLQ